MPPSPARGEITMATDHSPFESLQTPSKLGLTRRQVRWPEYFQACRFRWQYKPGRKNVADHLNSELHE